ncbi:MAG: DUF3306 domain-containing protein [Candidatus Thiodiazotropha sp.]
MSEDYTPDEVHGDESFLNRWSRRKLEAETSPGDESGPNLAEVEVEEQAPLLTDADMPSLESLDEQSEYRGFLSPGVSEGLRQAALQKLFRSSCFNVCDGLDDYAEDFTRFEKLGDLVTADLRHRLQKEAQRLAERADAATDGQAETASADSDTARQAQSGPDQASQSEHPTTEAHNRADEEDQNLS